LRNDDPAACFDIASTKDGVSIAGWFQAGMADLT
jgi:hypothetical protein